jgi:type I restriction enzyme S subunit
VIEGLRGYPEYRESDGQWLGEIPRGWSDLRLKHAVVQVNEPNVDVDDKDMHLALEDVEGGTGRINPSGTVSADDASGKRFRPDDVLFGKLRPYLAKVVRVTKLGNCVSEFLVLRTRDSSCVGPTYLESLLRSGRFIDAVTATTFGARMPRAEWADIGSLPIPVPPREEQDAIVRFLDHADRRIQRYICAKERLIELLEEEKQAIIHRAVTRGLDPNVKLKPSGVDWLGEVPQHWEVGQLRRWCCVIDCKHLTVPFVDDGTSISRPPTGSPQSRTSIWSTVNGSRSAVT